MKDFDIAFVRRQYRVDGYTYVDRYRLRLLIIDFTGEETVKIIIDPDSVNSPADKSILLNLYYERL